jgi:hypothetical protein
MKQNNCFLILYRGVPIYRTVDVRPRQFLDPGCPRVDGTPHFHSESLNFVHLQGVPWVPIYRTPPLP